MIEKCKFSSDEIKEAMKVGGLDMLCVIPQEEIEKYGIPFLRTVLKKDAEAATLEKWDIFWAYFKSQWLRIKESWNIIDKNGVPYDLINHTNNALESYNHRLNELFCKKPSLLEFVQVVENECRAQEAILDKIWLWRWRPIERREVFVPAVNPEYKRYKANMEAKAISRTAARKASKATGKK